MGIFFSGQDKAVGKEGNENWIPDRVYYYTSVENTTGVCSYDSMLWLLFNQKILRKRIRSWYYYTNTWYQIFSNKKYTYINDNVNTMNRIQKLKENLSIDWFKDNTTEVTEIQAVIWKNLLYNSEKIYLWYYKTPQQASYEAKKRKNHDFKQTLVDEIMTYSPNSYETSPVNDEITKAMFPGRTRNQPNWSGRVYYYMLSLVENTEAKEILQKQKEHWPQNSFQWNDLGAFQQDVQNMISMCMETKKIIYDYSNEDGYPLNPVIYYNEDNRMNPTHVIAFVPMIYDSNNEGREFPDTDQAFIREDSNNLMYFEYLIGMGGTKKEGANFVDHAVAYSKWEKDENKDERWHYFNNGVVKYYRTPSIKTKYINFMTQKEPDDSWNFIYRFPNDVWEKLIAENNMKWDYDMQNYVADVEKFSRAVFNVNKKIKLKF